MMQDRKFKYGLLFMAMVLLFASACQKVIDLKLDNAAPQLVIEGNLTDQNGAQVVTISKSVSFSATDSFPPVSGATVSISDSTGTPERADRSGRPVCMSFLPTRVFMDKRIL